jgi:trehalose-6-phosphatase
MGFGCIIRDYQGTVIAAASFPSDSLVEPVLAETLAALRAAKFCRNRGLQIFIMEGDSL